MRRWPFKKVLTVSATTFILLVGVLCIHIYLVTRPKAPDEHTIIMARVDFKQDISQSEADKVSAWVAAQPGVDHVLCNANTDILVFTFFPIKTSASKVIADLKSSFDYEKAVRFMPSEQDMKAGCPVAANSISYKAYNFIKNIF